MQGDDAAVDADVASLMSGKLSVLAAYLIKAEKDLFGVLDGPWAADGNDALEHRRKCAPAARRMAAWARHEAWGLVCIVSSLMSNACMRCGVTTRPSIAANVHPLHEVQQSVTRHEAQGHCGRDAPC